MSALVGSKREYKESGKMHRMFEEADCTMGLGAGCSSEPRMNEAGTAGVPGTAPRRGSGERRRAWTETKTLIARERGPDKSKYLDHKDSSKAYLTVGSMMQSRGYCTSSSLSTARQTLSLGR